MSLCLCLSLCLSVVVCEDGGPLDKYKIVIFGGNAHIKLYIFIFLECVRAMISLFAGVESS